MHLTPLHTIAYLATPGVGRKTTVRIQEFAKEAPSSSEDMQLLLERLKEEYPRTKVPNREDLDEALQKAERTIEACERLDIHVAVPGAGAFPSTLRELDERPALLYYRGSTSCLLDDRAVAVVGTRSPSHFGRACSERLGELFASHGFTVVSGLALGCDTAAHEGCLKAAGRALAVMAHGLDRVYPEENEALTGRILEAGGCLVSEHPPNTRPRRNYFVERNRLQSGFSRGVVVVETGRKGGTMHTARYALEQGRLLGCLLHPSKRQDRKTAGNQSLIEDEGAFPLGGESDIRRFIDRLEKRSSAPPEQQSTARQLSIFPEEERHD